MEKNDSYKIVLSEVKKIIKLFSEERISNKYTWYQIGKCLCGIDDRMFNMWIGLNNIEKEKCSILWEKMKPSNFTIGTLYYFAFRDSPSDYLKMKKNNIKKLIEHISISSHYTIAQIISEKYKFTYRCGSISTKDNIWYKFDNHRWIKIDGTSELSKIISVELTEEFTKYQIRAYDLAKEASGYEKEKYCNSGSLYFKIIEKFNISGFKQGVISECANIMYDPNFPKNLDKNNYLICFDNGVYDLHAGIFRDGYPDDYISTSVGYDYIEYDENNKITKSIMNFFKKIQPEEEMREYLLALLSSCLMGSEFDSNFYIFTGNNGKNKVMELMKYTFGNLFKTISSTDKEISYTQTVRICSINSEYDNDISIKNIVGNCLMNGIRPLLVCDYPPNINSTDDYFIKKINIVPFLNNISDNDSFSDEIQINVYNSEHHLWFGDNLDKKFINWKETFMSMLIHCFNKYKSFNEYEWMKPKMHTMIVRPELVIQATQKYQKECDIFQNFIDEYLEKTEDSKDMISCHTLYSAFNHWFRENYSQRPDKNTRDLKGFMQRKMPTYDSWTNHLTSYRIKQCDDPLNVLENI